MKKTFIIIAVVAVIALIIGGIALSSGKNSGEGIKLETAAEMQALIEKIYQDTEMPLQSLQTAEMVSYITGLKSNENVEIAIMSEPMMTSQAYSLVMVKAKENADVEAMKKEMVDNVDTRKWICVTAEKVYATNSGNVIFLVMSSEELAKPVYEAFKKEANGQIGKELERTEEVL